MQIIDYNPTIHKITSTIQQETVLTEMNIKFIKQMFKDKAMYQYYMKALWVLRRLAAKKCEIDVQGRLDINTEDEAYPIFKVTDELIGSLLIDGVFFNSNGDII